MKNEQKNKILYIGMMLIISFYSTSPLVLNSYLDPVTGYNSEYIYDTINTNGSFPDLRSIDEIEKESFQKEKEIIDNISTEFQDILKRSNFSIEEINMAINKINSNSKLRKFFIGNNLGILSFQLVQIKNQTYTLNLLENEDENIKIKINNQIKYLEKEKKMVEYFILEKKDKFSLFGWFVSSL